MPDWFASLKPLVSALLLPPGLVLLWLAVAAVLLWRGRRTVGGALLVTGLLAGWLLQTVALARWLEGSVLDIPAPLTTSQRQQLAQRPAGRTAIVVLGGGLRPMAPEFDGAAMLSDRAAVRLQYGAWLAAQTGLPMAYSGGIGWASRNDVPPEAEVAQRMLAPWRLTLRWREPKSRDTRENARYTVPMLAADGIREIVLVTDAAHMPRALRAFRAVAGERLVITPAPANFIAATTTTVWQWLPSVRGQELVAFHLHEWLGLLGGA